MEVLSDEGHRLGLCFARSLSEVDEEEKLLGFATHGDDVYLSHTSDRAERMHHIEHRRELDEKAGEG